MDTLRQLIDHSQHIDGRRLFTPSTLATHIKPVNSSPPSSCTPLWTHTCTLWYASRHIRQTPQHLLPHTLLQSILTLSSSIHAHQCQDIIRILEECHKTHPFSKFIGACNSAKANLDKCLADEFLVRRELNADKARRQQQRHRERHATDFPDQPN